MSDAESRNQMNRQILESYIQKLLKVSITDGRQYIGKLICTDKV